MTDHLQYTHGAAFRCLHCGAEYMPTYPCPIGAHRALAGWWRKTHTSCLPLAGRPKIEQHVIEPPSPVVVERILDRRHSSQVRLIQQVVAGAFDVPYQAIISDDRRPHYSRPRMVAMALARELTACSLTHIADCFARDHSTVVKGIQRVEGDESLRAQVERIRPMAVQALDRAGGVAWSEALSPRPA